MGTLNATIANFFVWAFSSKKSKRPKFSPLDFVPDHLSEDERTPEEKKLDEMRSAIIEIANAFKNNQ